MPKNKKRHTNGQRLKMVRRARLERARQEKREYYKNLGKTV
jgi:hypothetical protein